MNIEVVPVLNDNYVWLIRDEDEVFIVDPGEAAPVLKCLQENNLRPVGVVLTHYHADHVAGLGELLANYPSLTVYGPVEVAEFVNNVVGEGDSFTIFGETVQVLKTAGHTEEHISYLVGKHLFSGDALFMAGCGRVFTKDYAAQFDALQKFKNLANDTLVYAGHEYTLTNLNFALTVLEDVTVAKETIVSVTAKREHGQPSLPSTIGLERAINPFFQVETVDKFRELRNLRDIF